MQQANKKQTSILLDEDTKPNTIITTSYAIISVVKADYYQIKCHNQYFVAKKSFSCLLKPQKNDLVEIKVVDDEIYITTILERVDSSCTNLELPEQTTISSAGEITIQAQALRQKVLNYELCAKEALNVVANMKSFINECYHQTDFSQVKANQLLKEVKEFEQSMIKDLKITVTEGLKVDAQSATVTTSQDTVINARSVSLG